MFSCSIYTLVLAAIGLVSVCLFLLESLWSVLQLIHSILAPYFLPQELQSLVTKYGSWALVTGSTDGIGKAYARELAKRGLNIILVSRSEEKLETVAKEIEAEFGVKTKTIAADFSQGVTAVETVRSQLGSLPVGILVNNVGKQYSYPMYLTEVPEQELWEIININIGAVTMMTRIILEEMKRKGRGAIVNVSSGAELQPLPLMNVYAASKVYIKNFTQALRLEYSRFGITVQHLSPLFISTKMNRFSSRLQEASLLVPDAATYAMHAVNTLGKIDHTTGYWIHGIQYFFMTLAPAWLRMYIGEQINRTFRRDYFLQNKAE